MEKSARARLIDGIRVCLGELLERGEADNESVTECVMTRFPELCAAASDALMREAVGAMARKLMGREWSPDDKRQLALDLPLPIRHLYLPTAITVPVAGGDPTRVKWVALRSATLPDIEANLELLLDSIAADTVSANARQTLLNFIRPIMIRHPQMRLAEALRLAGAKAA